MNNQNPNSKKRKLNEISNENQGDADLLFG